VIDVYLFDWGDTLMVDFDGVPGKMFEWEVVEAVAGAREALEHLSRSAAIYIATGAKESTESDILKAFGRVGLNQFLTGCYCQANLGIPKGSPEFLPAIVDRLGTPVSRIAMVGDSLERDILPAAAIGMRTIWLSRTPEGRAPAGTRIIGDLRELCVAPADRLAP
jgi:putative hydrolase of the HAD superfamily